ncbi:MAG TPA: uroporphyrinogen decarboxylase family protein, partial [Phycisphaerae bacterium]|nr:uroporphyrinogen decarboxylase family protein [Phycisphaerae bacterium]
LVAQRQELVAAVEDLKKLRPVPGDVAYGGQLEVLRKLREKLGPDVLMTTTLFNAWAVLRYLTQPPSDVHGPPKMHSEDDRDETITALLRQDRQAVRAALQAIGETLADTARQCILAGADGVFLSVRDDWVNRPANGPDTYDELLRDIDLAILAAASAGTFNFVHACGRPQNFAAFADYPAQVINWADRSGGPSIAYARDRVRPAIAAGVDNLRTLPQGTPEACAAEVHDALRQAQTRPIIIAAGCTFDPQAVPPENLHAVVAAARSVAG